MLQVSRRPDRGTGFRKAGQRLVTGLGEGFVTECIHHQRDGPWRSEKEFLWKRAWLRPGIKASPSLCISLSFSMEPHSPQQLDADQDTEIGRRMDTSLIEMIGDPWRASNYIHQ